MLFKTALFSPFRVQRDLGVSSSPIPLFHKWETEAQRGEGTCPGHTESEDRLLTQQSSYSLCLSFRNPRAFICSPMPRGPHCSLNLCSAWSLSDLSSKNLYQASLLLFSCPDASSLKLSPATVQTKQREESDEATFVLSNTAPMTTSDWLIPNEGWGAI